MDVIDILDLKIDKYEKKDPFRQRENPKLDELILQKREINKQISQDACVIVSVKSQGILD